MLGLERASSSFPKLVVDLEVSIVRDAALSGFGVANAWFAWNLLVSCTFARDAGCVIDGDGVLSSKEHHFQSILGWFCGSSCGVLLLRILSCFDLLYVEVFHLLHLWGLHRLSFLRAVD